MAAIYLDRQTEPQFIERLGKINPTTHRLWGTMEPAEMLAHLRRTVEVSIGEIPVKDESNFLLRTVVRPIAFSGWLPWPKGKLKAPNAFVNVPKGEIEEEKQKLFAAIARFIAAAEKEPERVTISPNFGPTNLAYWRQVHGLHTEHHLRQFGL